METTELLRIMDKFEELSKKLDSLNIVPITNSPYESAEIKNLAAALAKAQGEYPPIDLNSENPFFKSRYANLNIILRSVLPVLSKYGLSFVQQLQTDDNGAIFLYSKLLHSTGEWISCRTRVIPLKNDPQSFGAAVTYLRRYSSQTLLGITAANDPDDDDAESLMVESRKEQERGINPNLKYDSKKESYITITKEQLEELEYELEGWPDVAEQLLHQQRIDVLANLPKSRFLQTINKVREIKRLRTEK